MVHKEEFSGWSFGIFEEKEGNVMFTPGGLDGDAKSFFGRSGSLAVQARNVEGDSDEISRELMGMALAETPQLERFPSLSLVIPKIQDNALHHQHISSANTAMPSTPESTL